MHTSDQMTKFGELEGGVLGMSGAVQGMHDLALQADDMKQLQDEIIPTLNLISNKLRDLSNDTAELRMEMQEAKPE